MQAQAGFNQPSVELVIPQEIESKGERWTLIQNDIVMCHPKRVIELLVVVILIVGVVGLQGIAQRLADLHFFGEAKTGGCPAPIQPGGILEDGLYGRRRW